MFNKFAKFDKDLPNVAGKVFAITGKSCHDVIKIERNYMSVKIEVKATIGQ